MILKILSIRVQNHITKAKISKLDSTLEASHAIHS